MTQPTQSARVRPQPVFRTLAAALLVLLLASCAWRGGPADGATAAEAGLPPLETLMGEWYVAARVPWFGERGRVAASYRFSAEDADARRIGIERTWRDGFDGSPVEIATRIDIEVPAHGVRVLLYDAPLDDAGLLQLLTQAMSAQRPGGGVDAGAGQG